MPIPVNRRPAGGAKRCPRGVRVVPRLGGVGPLTIAGYFFGAGGAAGACGMGDAGGAGGASAFQVSRM